MAIQYMNFEISQGDWKEMMKAWDIILKDGSLDTKVKVSLASKFTDDAHMYGELKVADQLAYFVSLGHLPSIPLAFDHESGKRKREHEVHEGEKKMSKSV